MPQDTCFHLCNYYSGPYVIPNWTEQSNSAVMCSFGPLIPLKQFTIAVS